MNIFIRTHVPPVGCAGVTPTDPAHPTPFHFLYPTLRKIAVASPLSEAHSLSSDMSKPSRRQFCWPRTTVFSCIRRNALTSSCNTVPSCKTPLGRFLLVDSTCISSLIADKIKIPPIFGISGTRLCAGSWQARTYTLYVNRARRSAVQSVIRSLRES